jgi:uncharacterized membrane protein
MSGARTRGTSWVVNHAKLWVAAVVGGVICSALPHPWAILTRALVGWNAAVLILLPLTYMHLRGLNAKQLRERYRADDPSASVILKSVAPHDKLAHVLLAALTIIDSWLLVPTMFTVHYADMFYSAEVGEQPLRFPETPEPVFWDFAYFSFTIAAACQTADVETTQVAIRRTVMAQSIISFLFNLAILGFAVNVTAGLLA